MYGVYFERFRAKNAYPFKEIDINLKNQGLVRLAGPNGSGKSSACHLLTQTAMGTNPNSAKKSDIMIEEKDFLLELTFTKNNTQYIAAHSTKSKTLSPAGQPYGTGVYLFRNGQDISQHKDLDTQKLIKATLGWSLDEWYGYVYLAQATSHTLINGTRSERQQYLSALFNLQPLDTLMLHFKQKAESLNDKILELEKSKQELAIKTQMLGSNNLAALEEKQISLKEELEVLNSKIKKLEFDQRKYEKRIELVNKIALANNEVDKLDSFKEQLIELEKQQATFTSNQILKSQHVLSLQSLVEIKEPKIPTDWKVEYEDSPDIDEIKEQGVLDDLIHLENNLVEVPTVQIPLDFTEVLNSPDINLAQVKRQIAEIEKRPAPPAFPKPTQNQLTALVEEKTDISYKILNFKTEVQRLQFNETVCDKCGTQLNCEDREAKLQQKINELNDLQEELAIIQKKLSTQESRRDAWLEYDALGPDRSDELPNLKASISLFEQKLSYQNIKLQADKRQQYEKHLEAIKAIPSLKEKIRIFKLKKQYKEVQVQDSKFKAYIAEKDKLENLIKAVPETKDMSFAIAELKTKIEQQLQVRSLIEEFETVKTAEDKSTKLDLLKGDLNTLNQSIGTLGLEIKKAKELAADISRLQEKISAQDNIVRDQKRYALLAKAYGKAGVLREIQLSKFSRYLEEALLANTIKQLPHHRFHFRVDDGIDILAEYIGKDKPTKDPYDVKFMSGGEKGALSVAFLFALDDLLPPERRTSLKILDETESALDAERQQDFIQYTLPLLKQRAETVIVISHSHAANAGVFDKVWEIKSGVLTNTKETREFA